jgi:hypothetical protein
MIAVLHLGTEPVPALHCIVGGGVDKIAMEEYKRRWQILVSSQGVVQGFRAKYCELYKRKPIIILESRNNFGRNSGSFCQKAFGSPKSVVEYLGRYTHKIAISNHRIQSVNDQM